MSTSVRLTSKRVTSGDNRLKINGGKLKNSDNPLTLLTLSNRLIPQRGGAIGGAFTYTIRPQGDGYHLSVKDAISHDEREWTAASDCADLMVFAVLHEREYGLLLHWLAQFEGKSFEGWVHRLEYQFCHNTLGRIIRVRDLETEMQLDLTDYEGW